MAICVLVDNPSGSADTFEQITQRLRESGALPPAGGIFQVAGPFDGGWRVISVWESEASLRRFQEEHLFPAFQEVGVSQDDVTIEAFQVHSYMLGEQSGAAAPA
jgi:hypothetical protein